MHTSSAGVTYDIGTFLLWNVLLPWHSIPWRAWYITVVRSTYSYRPPLNCVQEECINEAQAIVAPYRFLLFRVAMEMAVCGGRG